MSGGVCGAFYVRYAAEFSRSAAQRVAGLPGPDPALLWREVQHHAARFPRSRHVDVRQIPGGTNGGEPSGQ